MKLYVGKDYYGDRGYFLAHSQDGHRYYYNKILKDFEVKNVSYNKGDDNMYYIDFKMLAGILSWSQGCELIVSPDIQDDQLRDFVATLNFIQPQESQVATDSFKLYGAL